MGLFAPVDAFLERALRGARSQDSRRRLRAYLDRVEATYGQHPYHNLRHVEEVVACAARFWLEMGLGALADRVNPGEQDVLAHAFIVGAAVHDCGHLGLTNEFLIRSHHPYALAFNDVSPNESHHASTACRLILDDPGATNFLLDLPPTALWAFRQHLMALVLATDMGRHHAVLSNLVARGLTPDMGASELGIVMQAALKCADVGHVFMPFEQHAAWARRLQDEMTEEGDRWKDLGWKPPSAMDRDQGGSLAASQLAFFRYIVMPLAEALVVALPDMAGLLQAARANELAWKAAARRD